MEEETLTGSGSSSSSSSSSSEGSNSSVDSDNDNHSDNEEQQQDREKNGKPCIHLQEIHGLYYHAFDFISSWNAGKSQCSSKALQPTLQYSNGKDKCHQSSK